jgi:hypothetical protein
MRSSGGGQPTSVFVAGVGGGLADERHRPETSRGQDGSVGVQGRDGGV